MSHEKDNTTGVGGPHKSTGGIAKEIDLERRATRVIWFCYFTLLIDFGLWTRLNFIISSLK